MTRGDGIWAHPWDLSVRRVEAVAEAGLASVSVATAYHAATFLDPGTLRRRRLAGAAVLVRLPGWSRAHPMLHRVPVADPAALLDRLRRHGLTGRAWVVLHHDLRTPRALQVVTAAGDPLPHAACPTAPEVRALDRHLVASISRAAGWDGLDLEGVGWHGLEHADHHPKRPDGIDELGVLLGSLCFCSRCQAGFGGTVGPIPALRRRLVAAIRDRFDRGGASSTLPEDVRTDVAAILEWRRSVVRDVLGELLASVEPSMAPRVRVAVSASPHATGAHAPYDPAWPPTLAGLIAAGPGRSSAAAADDVSRLRALAPSIPISATLSVPAPAETGATSTGRTSAVRAAGAASVTWYHLGLAPLRWTAALRRA